MKASLPKRIQNAQNLLAALDLKKLDDEVLRLMILTIESEVARRNGEKRNEKKIYQRIRQRIKGASACDRSQEDLFDAAWDALYPEKDQPERTFYVYAHVKPDVGCIEVKTHPDDWTGVRIYGRPFYIGKGCGDRAFDLNRNQGHGEEIRALIKAGRKPSELVCIVKDNLSEQEALKLEAKLIYFFGTKYEADVLGCLVNLDRPPRPASFGLPRLEKNKYLPPDGAPTD